MDHGALGASPGVLQRCRLRDDSVGIGELRGDAVRVDDCPPASVKAGMPGGGVRDCGAGHAIGEVVQRVRRPGVR